MDEAARGPAVRAPSRPVSWPRWCANHPLVRSTHVCPRCVNGYCEPCTQKVQGGSICATCDSLCVTSAQYEKKKETERQRGRSMADDLGLIARYPFRDPLGFALLALFTWVFGYLNAYLAHGVMVLYAFHALTRVSNGDLASFLPDGDLTEIMKPARLALAALVISSGPLMLVTLLVPGADLRDIMGAGASDDVPLGAGGAALLAVALVWMLAYTPIAMTVAALSHNYLPTLNPAIGIDTIRRMGRTYWHAMAIYTVLALAQWGLELGLRRIPIAGALVLSFVDAYAWLAIACTLGLAVFKKAEELGWD